MASLASRRNVLAGLAAAMSTRPARSQRILPIVGFMGFATAEGDAPTLAAFREGLREQGIADGQGVRVEARHAGGDVALARSMIEDLERLPVAVFLAPGATAARSIRRISARPVVSVGLPGRGEPELFQSVSHPAGTVTGLSSFGEDLSAKRIEILREALPALRTIGVLHNATDPMYRDWGLQTEQAIQHAGLSAIRVTLSSTSPEDLGVQLEMIRAGGGAAVVVIRDFLTQSLRREIIAQAHARGLMVIAEQSVFVDDGALLSYGPDIGDLFRRAAGYVARILKGTPPGDIPIEFPVRFELAVNLRTARTSGLVLPQAILARADELVE